MSMMKLAMQNFKSSLKNYLALIFSLAFTILVFLNFQYIVYSDAFETLGKQNADYIKILVQVISFVLGCFMFFFIWYSTNVFLTKRKKEIGIYVFMGLTNQKIGRLYMIESIMTGISALVLGIVFGILTTQLFQMILLAVSDVAVEIEFHFILEPVLITIGVYLVMYLIFVMKGYVNIVRSSVLDMVSANRRNEYMKQKSWVLAVKTVLGVGILTAGYYLAVKDGGMEVMGNVLAAAILVVAGVYFLFGGLIPAIFQGLAGRKKFLYHKERALWINSVVFRMKKNYRTYAMVCVLMICSVTALATGFAMKMRYDSIIHFRNTYTFQIVSTMPDLESRIESLIEKDNDIEYSTQAAILQLEASEVKEHSVSDSYGLISYSQIEKLAKEAGLTMDVKKPSDGEIVDVSNMYLLSLYTDRSGVPVTIDGKQYLKTQETNTPYLGYLQENMSFYMVNDQEYEKLLPLGQELYTYNFRIKDISQYKASLDDLDTLVSQQGDNYTGRIAVDPNSSDIEWIKILYSICIFMFLVFTLASGSILYMKLYNDAFEERERYRVLQKLGVSQRTLRHATAKELGSAYLLPFAVMAISSYFSVHALGKMMNSDLLLIQLISLLVILVIFSLSYVFSVIAYQKNVEG